MIGETEEQHCKTEGQTHHGKEDFLRDRNKAQDQPSPVHPDIGTPQKSDNISKRYSQFLTGLSICCCNYFLE